LADSLPQGRAFPAKSLRSGEAFAALDRLLDEARTGPTYLRVPQIAALVEESILYRRSQYELHAYVIMPNHVHLLVTPQANLVTIMKSLKRFTARAANAFLSRTGTAFWQEESFDHLVRNENEFAKIKRYIERNPVRAGLARTPEEFRWSSAWAERDSSTNGG